MPVWTDKGRSKSSLVQSLYDWWLAKAGDAGVPSRGCVDPAELKTLLKNVLISEVHLEPFRYRLTGTKVVEATGFDITGHFLDELVPSDQGEPWMEHYREAYEGRQPILGETTVPTSTGGTFTYEFAICPLRNGGTEVRQFIAIEDYFDLQVPLLEPKPWQRATRRS
jgi:hypothetical protein